MLWQHWGFNGKKTIPYLSTWNLYSSENHKYLFNSYTSIWLRIVIRSLRKIQDAAGLCKKRTLPILEADFITDLSNKGESIGKIYPRELHDQKFSATELSFLLCPFSAFCSLVSHLVVLNNNNKIHF